MLKIISNTTPIITLLAISKLELLKEIKPLLNKIIEKGINY